MQTHSLPLLHSERKGKRGMHAKKRTGDMKHACSCSYSSISCAQTHTYTPHERLLLLICAILAANYNQSRVPPSSPSPSVYESLWAPSLQAVCLSVWRTSILCKVQPEREIQGSPPAALYQMVKLSLQPYVGPSACRLTILFSSIWQEQQTASYISILY